MANVVVIAGMSSTSIRASNNVCELTINSSKSTR
jgi:hypothetical protein